jgi:hypothetical protein
MPEESFYTPGTFSSLGLLSFGHTGRVWMCIHTWLASVYAFRLIANISFWLGGRNESPFIWWGVLGYQPDDHVVCLYAEREI